MSKIMEEFLELRKRLFKAIDEYFSDPDGDGACKSYEGTFEIEVGYPDYFEDENASKGPDFYMIKLHCYVIGPNRHYEWKGKTLAEALHKCKNDIDDWIGDFRNENLDDDEQDSEPDQEDLEYFAAMRELEK